MLDAVFEVRFRRGPEAEAAVKMLEISLRSYPDIVFRMNLSRFAHALAHQCAAGAGAPELTRFAGCASTVSVPTRFITRGITPAMTMAAMAKKMIWRIGD